MKDIKLIGKKIIIDKCKTLLTCAPDENYTDLFEHKAGEWKFENGYLIGKEDGNKGGILYTKESYDKPVMISFTAASVLPATRDVNAVFCANWDDDVNDLGDSYVCGVGGWYDNKAGLERNIKGNKLAFRSITSSYQYVPGKEIRLTCGAIDGHIFMVIDDELVAEYIEYDTPLKSGHIGFSPFCTILKIKDIEVKEIYFEKVKEHYDPEF